MPFSLALLLLILYIEYLAIKKQKRTNKKEDVNKVWTPSTHLQR